MAVSLSAYGPLVAEEGATVFSRDVSITGSSAAEGDLVELKRAALQAKYANQLKEVRKIWIYQPV